MITHGSTDWAAAMPQTARATAEMSFILRFGRRLRWSLLWSLESLEEAVDGQLGY